MRSILDNTPRAPRTMAFLIAAFALVAAGSVHAQDAIGAVAAAPADDHLRSLTEKTILVICFLVGVFLVVRELIGLKTIVEYSDPEVRSAIDRKRLLLLALGATLVAVPAIWNAVFTSI